MAKFEVQVRKCFCCGLTVGTVYIGLYTLFLFILLTALASWGLSDTNQNGDRSHFTSCELEAQGKINADNRKLVIQNGHQTVIIEDSTSYHCSFGLYTEELKFEAATRKSLLWFNIILFILIVIASILLLIGLAVHSEWLLIPWIVLMTVEVVRGLISTFFLFWISYWNLARIATAIFFLGVQLFHISLIVLVIAKFQQLHNLNTGVIIDDAQFDVIPRPYTTATLPSAYGGAYSPSAARYPQDPQVNAAYSDYSVSQKDPRYYDQSYRQPPPPPTAQGIRY